MIATTRGALVRGTTTKDALGDEVDTNETVAGFNDFPMSLTEKSRNVQDPATGTWRTIRYFVGRIPSNVPVEDGDRIRDLADGQLYTIEENEPVRRSISGRSSHSLDLKRTGE